VPQLDPLSAFSVVTIMQIEGDKLVEAVADGDTMHRVLQGLCRWSPTWQADKLVEVAKSRCQARRVEHDSHIVLRSERGRTVWFPDLAAQAGQPTLGCYHRNLVAVAFQTEALGLLVGWLDSRLDAWGELPGVVQTWGRRAGGCLQRLYSGVRKTYRTGSCRAHVDDSGWVEALNRLRTRAGVEPA
jgi:hypothetical protein